MSYQFDSLSYFFEQMAGAFSEYYNRRYILLEIFIRVGL
jgi:hypothetical protein